MIQTKYSLTGKISSKQSLKGNVNNAIIEKYPDLEDLEITPKSEDQHFKSEKYGFDNVTVKAIETEELSILPNKEEQIIDGIFNRVTVEGDSNLAAENIKKDIEIFGVRGVLESDISLNLLNMRPGTFVLTNSAILQTNTDTPCYLEQNTTYTLVIEYENLNTTVNNAKIQIGIGCGKTSYDKDIEGAIPYPTENSGKLIYSFNTGTKVGKGERCFVRPIRISASSNTGTTSVYWKNVMLLKGTYNINNVPQYIPVTKEELAKGLFVSTAEGSIRGEIVNTDIVTLHNYSFYGRSYLEKVSFPNLTSIYAYSFFNCARLTYADLGLASSLNVGTFQGCTSLKALILRKTSVITLHSTGAFTNSGISLGTGYIYVPDELVEKYKVATNWSTYADQIKPISELGV